MHVLACAFVLCRAGRNAKQEKLKRTFIATKKPVLIDTPKGQF